MSFALSFGEMCAGEEHTEKPTVLQTWLGRLQRVQMGLKGSDCHVFCHVDICHLFQPNAKVCPAPGLLPQEAGRNPCG